MKNSIKVLCLACSAMIMFSSCSKDEENSSPQYGEKNVVVAVTYGGDYEDYEEVIGLQIVGNNAGSTEIEGIEWTDITRPDKLAAQFQRTGEASGSFTLRTTKPISECTFVTSFVPKEGVEIEEPMTINVQYYIQEELVKTDNYSTEDGKDSYLGVLVIDDYVK